MPSTNNLWPSLISLYTIKPLYEGPSRNCCLQEIVFDHFPPSATTFLSATWVLQPFPFMVKTMWPGLLFSVSRVVHLPEDHFSCRAAFLPPSMAGYLHNMHPALPQPAARTNWLMARPPQQSSQHQPTQPPWSANWPGKQKSKRRSHKSHGDQEYFPQVFRKGKQQFHPISYHGTTQYYWREKESARGRKIDSSKSRDSISSPRGQFSQKKSDLLSLFSETVFKPG